MVSELGALATGSDMEISPPSRPLLSSPNRFTRTSSSAYWNTGQGSPDAVCFSIDRAGVLIAGVGLYGGTGQYDYEIDLLDEVRTGKVHYPNILVIQIHVNRLPGKYASPEVSRHFSTCNQ